MHVATTVSLCCILAVTQGKVDVSRLCGTRDDCSTRQCCVSFYDVDMYSIKKNRRYFRLGEDVIQGYSGVCRPYRKSYQSCLVEPTRESESVFYNECPCAAGYVCLPDKREPGSDVLDSDNPQHDALVWGRCHRACETSGDCKRRECCVGVGNAGTQAGVCRTLAKKGQECSLTNPGDLYPSSCPCRKRLQCEARPGENPCCKKQSRKKKTGSK